MAELTGGRIFGVYDAPIEGGKWGNRFSASIDSYQAGMQGVGEELAGAAGLDGVQGFFRSAREENEAQAEYQRRQAQRQGAILSHKDANSVGDYADWLGGLAVDSAPYLVESALGGIAGRALLTGGKTALGLSRAAAGTVGGVAASYTSAVGDILQNQRDENGTTDLGSAALGGIPYAALNALGVSGAASRAGGLRRAGIDMLDNMGVNGGSLARVGGALARTGVAFGKNALEEGIGETGQEMINQGFGRMAVNPDQTLFNPEANERYLESFIGGAALGGVVGGAAGGWRRSEGFRLPADQSLDDPAKPADLLGSKLTDATPGAQGSLFGDLGTEGLASTIPLLPGETDNASQYRALQEQLQGITDPAERRAAELNWLPDQPTNAGQADFLQQYQQLAGSLQQVESGMADAEAAGDANRFYALQELRDDLASQLEPMERRFSAIQAEQVQPGQMGLFSSGEAPIQGIELQQIPNAPDVQLYQDPTPLLGGPAPAPMIATQDGLVGRPEQFSGQQFNLFGGPTTFGEATPTPVEQQAPPAQDTRTRDMLTETPTAMVQTMFNPATEPSATGTRGAVAGNIRSQLIQQLGGSGDTNLATMLSLDIAKHVGDPQSMVAAVEKARAQVEKNLESLNRKVTGGSDMLSPDKYTEQRAKLDSKLTTIYAAQELLQRYQSAMTNAYAAEGAAKAPLGQTNKSSFSGEIDLAHTSSNPSLTVFDRNHGGVRHDGHGGTFGSNGVYLDHQGGWTRRGNGLFSTANVYRVKGQFKNAFVLTPNTVDDLIAKLGPPDLTAPKRGMRGGPQIVEALRKQGYDGIIVDGFGSETPVGSDSAKVYPTHAKVLPKLIKARISADITQDQVFAFNPENQAIVAKQDVGPESALGSKVPAASATEQGMRARSEQALTAERDAEIAAAVAETDTRTAAGDADRAAQNRREVLDSVLADTNPRNWTTAAFREALKAAGIRDTRVRPEEQQAIVTRADRRNDTRAAAVVPPALAAANGRLTPRESLAPAQAEEAVDEQIPAETGAVAPAAKAVPATRAASQPVEAAGVTPTNLAPETAPTQQAPAVVATETVAPPPATAKPKRPSKKVPFSTLIEAVESVKGDQEYTDAVMALRTRYEETNDVAEEDAILDYVDSSDPEFKAVWRTAGTAYDKAQRSERVKRASKPGDSGGESGKYDWLTKVISRFVAGSGPLPSGDEQNTRPQRPAADRRTNPQGGGGNRPLAEGARTKQSRGSSASGSGGAGLYPAVRHYTVETLTEELKRFVRADALGRAVRVIDSVADIPHWVDTSGVDASTQALTAISNGRATVFLIADRIRKGRAKAVFLHEVGVHLGLERLLPTAVYKKIVGRIQTLRENYLSGADTSVSAMLASAAYDRVVSAHPNTTESADPGLFASELVAYFVEESVIAGIDPTASTKLDAPLRSWFRTLWASFKSALRRLGYKDASSFTAQDAVDMAYGAARLEVAGTFHGTAANFRRFDHKFMGSGEGAQAFGWGTYLAQRFGIATDYWAADINRKKRNGASPEGGVMRVDSAVMEGDLLDWYAPMSEQSALLEKVKAQMPSDLLAAVEAEVKKPLESMTGADLYEAMVFIGGRGSDLVSRNVRNVRQNAGAAEVASRYLDEVLDVPGIRFFDAASRTPAGVLVYRGDVYTPDDLRNLRKQGGDLGAYASTLRSVLRNGLDAEIRDLEAKVKATSDMLFGVDRDSAARFGVPFDADSAKQRAEAEAMKTFDGQQLAWLQANRGDIEVRTVDRTKNLVVFNDKNIYRVSTRRGNSRERTLFSKSIPSEADLKAAEKAEGVPPEFSKKWEKTPFGVVVRNAAAGWRGMPKLLGLLTLDQIKDRFPQFKNVSATIDSWLRMGARANQMMRPVADLHKQWAGFTRGNKVAGQTLNKLFIEATLGEVWVDGDTEPRLDPRNKHLNFEDPQVVKAAAAARSLYMSLPKEGQRLYREITADMERQFGAKQQALLKRVVDIYKGDLAGIMTPEQMQSLAEMGKLRREEFVKANRSSWGPKATGKVLGFVEALDTSFVSRGEVQGPYFPLTRKGDHVVVFKSEGFKRAELALKDARQALDDLLDKPIPDDGAQAKTLENAIVAARKQVTAAKGALETAKASDKDYVVEFYEYRVQAMDRAKELGEGANVKARQLFLDRTDGIPSGFLNKLEAQVRKELGSQTSKDVSEAVRQMVIRSLPERSAFKAELRRMKVAGANPEHAMWSYLSGSHRNAWTVSRLENITEMTNSLNAARASEDQDEVLVANELVKRYAQSMTYTETNALIDAASNLSYLTHLGFSIGYWVQNMSQPWTVSLPVMAGRYGYKASAKALADATGDAVRAVRATIRKNKANTNWEMPFDLSTFKDHEQTLLNKLLDAGKIDITIRADLTSGESTSTNSLGHVVQQAANVSSLPAHMVESVNRLATALAAYRLELEKGSDVDAATAAAEKLVVQTHVDYSMENAPRYMNPNALGGLGRLAFQFRRYQQAMVFLWGKLLVDTLKHGDKESAKALMYLTGTTLATAGMSGLPLAAPLGLVVAGLNAFGDDDEDKDRVEWIWAGIQSVVGENATNLLRKGAPAMLGVDMSQRIGMGSILSPIYNMPNASTGQEWVGAVAATLLGASGGMVAGWADAMYLAKDNPVKAVEKILPAGGKAILQAVDREQRGITDRKGNVLVDPAELGGFDFVTKALNLGEVTDVSNMYATRAAVKDAETNRTDVRNRLMREYTRARLEGDADAVVEARAEIDAFNERQPGARIKFSNLQASYKEEQRRRRELQAGVRITDRNRDIAEDFGVTAQ